MISERTGKSARFSKEIEIKIYSIFINRDIDAFLYLYHRDHDMNKDVEYFKVLYGRD